MLRRSTASLLAPLMLASFVLAAGCGAVRARRGEAAHAGFLRDYSQLEENPDYPAKEIYINPDAVWTKYDSLRIDSVTLWASSATAVAKEEDRQMLTDLMYTALNDQLGKEFHIVQNAGPRTLRVRVAITQVKGANVPMRTMTTVLPQALILGAATSVAVDTATTVGSATIEAEVLDSVTEERLAAAVDIRAGVKDITSVRTFQKWGDVEAAAEFWAEGLTRFLIGIGVKRKASGS